MLRDDTGQECDSLADVHQAAASSISELIAEHIVLGKTVDLSHRVEVEDAAGATVATVRFGDFFCGNGRAPCNDRE